MKRALSIAVTVAALFLPGCGGGSSTNNSGGGTNGTPTNMQGSWTVQAQATTGGLVIGKCAVSCSGTYTVALVPSPCSVVTPVGTFSVKGPVCFIANNNSGQGSITGTGLTPDLKDTGRGVLIGVPANPAAAGAKFELLFVEGDKFGKSVEFSGGGSVVSNTMKGTASCSSPICQGITASFTGTL